MDKYLYFRGIVDEDNDDGNTGSTSQLSSVCIPARRITGLAPAGATTLTIFFETIRNAPGHAGASGDEIVSDFITVTVTAHRHKKVMDEILRAISSTGPMYGDGFIDVVDTCTVIAGGAAGSRTATSIHPDLTGVSGYSDDTDFAGFVVFDALS